MKSPRAKVEDFLKRVPSADSATIAKALRMDEGQVQLALLEAAITRGVAGSEQAVAPPSTLRQLFDAFTTAATEAASTRPPMRQSDANTSIEEMREAFEQLLRELGEE